MKSDFYTKTLLTIGVALLGLIALKPFISPEITVKAQARPQAVGQQWEYKVIVRNFTWDNAKIGAVSSFSEDEQQVKPIPNMVAVLSALGAQGWEVVSVTPYSTDFGRYLDSDPGLLSPAHIVNTNGVSTMDKWLFKRPKT